MARPKSSLIGLGSGVLDAYSANKLRKMGNEFDRLEATTAVGTAMNLAAIGNVADLQVASMHMIREVDTKLQTLSGISWNIASYYDRKEKQEAFIATLRYTVHSLRRALDQIDAISGEYPEYALYQIDRVAEMIEKRDVRVEHFAHAGEESMDRAQDLIDRVREMKESLFSKLGEMDGN